MIKEHHYVCLLKEKLDSVLVSQEELAPILNDTQNFNKFPNVVQVILYNEANSLAQQIENIENKINEYHWASEEERIKMNMTAWYIEEKRKRDSRK